MKTYRNYNSKEHIGEVNTEPSLTVPDMALTAREVIRRFTQGRPLPGNPNLMFPPQGEKPGEEVYIPDMRRHDITEQHEILEAHKAYIERQISEEKEKQKLRKAASMEKLKEQPIEPKKDEHSEDNNGGNGGENVSPK